MTSTKYLGVSGIAAASAAAMVMFAAMIFGGMPAKASAWGGDWDDWRYRPYYNNYSYRYYQPYYYHYYQPYYGDWNNWNNNWNDWEDWRWR